MIPLAAPTGCSVAVVGSGPAGLSCAGELAKRGHSVTIFEKRELSGGLSTYGILGLREPLETSLGEVQLIESLGVRFENNAEFGKDFALPDLQSRFDVVFLSIGMGPTIGLEIPGEEWIVDGLAYIERSKLNGREMRVGRRVAVIGAGNTAIDCATIAKRLGAQSVTMVYRRSENEMSAYPHELEFIRKEGVAFRFFAQPVAAVVDEGKVSGLRCVEVELGPPDASGRPAPRPLPGSEFTLAADQIIKAVGQSKRWQRLGLALTNGFLAVDDAFQTSVPGVFAGGDCIRATGTASTVMAVQDGKLAALAIHENLLRKQN